MALGEFQGVLPLVITKIIDSKDVGALTINQITFCNQNAINCQYSLAVINNGESIEAKHYVYFNAIIDGYQTFTLLKEPFTLKGDQEIWMLASNDNISFQIDSQ